MNPRPGVSDYTVDWMDGMILSSEQPSPRAVFPASLPCWVEMLWRLWLREKAPAGSVTPGLVACGTLSLVSIGTDPHRADHCLYKYGQTNPFFII